MGPPPTSSWTTRIRVRSYRRKPRTLLPERRRRVPRKAFWKFGELMWRLRLAETPPGNLHFIIHPWVVSTDRLKATGWSPRHTSRETFEITRDRMRVDIGELRSLMELSLPLELAIVQRERDEESVAQPDEDLLTVDQGL